MAKKISSERQLPWMCKRGRAIALPRLHEMSWTGHAAEPRTVIGSAGTKPIQSCPVPLLNVQVVSTDGGLQSGTPCIGLVLIAQRHVDGHIVQPGIGLALLPEIRGSTRGYSTVNTGVRVI